VKHAEAYERRRLIAEHAAEHGTTSAMQQFQASRRYVYECCNEHRKSPARKTDMQTYAIIAGLLRGERQSDIARRCAVSRQRVNAVKVECQKHGILKGESDE
jgi:hypothetical protein